MDSKYVNPSKAEHTVQGTERIVQIRFSVNAYCTELSRQSALALHLPFIVKCL
jgi:hypothetical protein